MYRYIHVHTHICTHTLNLSISTTVLWVAAVVSTHLQWWSCETAPASWSRETSRHTTRSPITWRLATPSATTCWFTARLRGLDPVPPWHGYSDGHEMEIQPVKTRHLLRADHHQQECPGPPQQHQTRDMQEQGLPGSAHVCRLQNPRAIRSNLDRGMLRRKQAAASKGRWTTLPQPQSNKRVKHLKKKSYLEYF